VRARGNRERSWWDFGGFYRAQPAWARKLYWFATTPVFLLWGWFIVSGAIETHRDMALFVFGVFSALAVIHNFYFLKALVGGRD
jgi:hypothetical protein